MTTMTAPAGLGATWQAQQALRAIRDHRAAAKAARADLGRDVCNARTAK